MVKKRFVAVAVVACAAGSAMADLHPFPSSASTVVGSVGFIDGDEVGHFWSVSRGDRVSETFADPLASVNRAIINVGVPRNSLTSGNFVDWEVSLNGTVVDMFRVDSGFLGTVSRDVMFAPVGAVGGSYDVTYRALNEVPGGGGSHTFAYAGDFSHSIELVPAPGSAVLLGLGGLALSRRRR